MGGTGKAAGRIQTGGFDPLGGFRSAESIPAAKGNRYVAARFRYEGHSGSCRPVVRCRLQALGWVNYRCRKCG